ncbi:MAG: C-GCAxxG-C-C family protein [Lachnospiraceae bacterium]|nr:C-GCAxxG-C-C family protein [Lachnospiraceae bacterium]
MEFKATEVSLKKVQQDAENLFREGLFCSEALMSAVRSNFNLQCSEEVIAMASGMPVGIGRSGCVCGALNGGVMALGCFFGRTKAGDEKVEKNIKVANELHDWFKEANGKNAICCRVLTKEFDKSKGEHKEQCIRFTGLAAWKVAEIITREFGLKNLDQ